ncbi:MAG: FtsX-like permease family protein [Acidobacteriota bacterium]
MGRTTPLAWMSLIHDWRRLLASVSGVGFAVLLMATELGFLHSIYDSSTLVLDVLDGELLMVSTLKDDFNPSKPFPRSRLEQALGFPEVEAVYPLWLSRLVAWSTRGAVERDLVRLLAFDPVDPIFTLPEIAAQQHLLRRPDTALVDRRLRDVYGGGLRAGAFGELGGRRIEIVGDFELGPDLQLNANLLVSDLTFHRTLFAPGANERPLEQVEIGVLRLADGVVPETFASRLQDALPDDVRCLTPHQLRREIHGFWTRHQPVGAVFGIGLLVGFFIGLMICYQVLFTDVVDQLPQFATLKAIGYPDRFLTTLAVRRGLYLALMALAVGLPAALLTYHLLAELTGLRFALTLGRAVLVAVAAIVMCILASLLATRRAIRTDPAEVF